MRRAIIGIACGIGAGVIDLIPMIIQRLPWTANLSAFLMWVVVGYLISVVEIKIAPVFKGILVAFLVMTPCGVLIGESEPMTLLPISLMTTFLGGLLGFVISKLKERLQR